MGSDNNTQTITHILSTEKTRSVAIVLVWAGAMGALFSRAMFLKTFPDIWDYAALIGVCVIAGALLEDIQQAIIGCILALVIGLTIVFVLAITAVSLAGIPPIGIDVLQSIWIYIIFQSVFPFPLIEFIAASMVGSLIGERFLQ